MRNLLALFSIFMFFLGISGCASKHMEPVATGAANVTVGANESAVVFLRSTTIGGAIQAPVVEGGGVLNSDSTSIHFVAIVSAGAKVFHKTTPGKHFYVVGGESSEMLEATLTGGKTYYVRLSPRIGFVKARFVFEPIPQSEVATAGFKKDFDWCDWYANSPSSTQWFNDNLPSLQEKYAKAAEKHRTGSSKDRKVMPAEYGMDIPLR